MTDRFEQLTSGISRIYKSIQKLKRQHTGTMGLKGTHVMCIHYLFSYKEGLTAASLCKKCREDKAGISRILADLKRLGLIQYGSPADGRKYRAAASLTPEGIQYAKEVNSLILQFTQAAGKDISEHDRQIFYQVLFHIADNLEQLQENIENNKK